MSQVLDKEARRLIRQQKAAALGPASVSAGGQRSAGNKGWVALCGSAAATGTLVWALSSDTEVGASMRNSDAWKWILAQTGEISRPFSEPIRQKLLPDWPYFPNTPPGTPCPPTLVLDLEGTLCTSVWDHKYGWRHVKRPGVEKFLKEMAQYYEVVIFTSNLGGIADPIISALDKVRATAAVPAANSTRADDLLQLPTPDTISL